MQTQKGISLLEVMISLLLLSILLLGIDGLQVASLQKAKANYYYTVALSQLHAISQLIKFIKEGDITNQINEWNEQNKQALPNGRGEVTGHYPNYRLSIYWGNDKQTTCSNNKIGKQGCLQLIIE